MSQDDNVIQSGPFKGKRIEFASTAGVDMFPEISADFIKKIFGFDPGEYLITDESSLYDFLDGEERELSNIHEKIQDVYGLDVSDIPSGNLLEIFKRIHHYFHDSLV